MTEQGVILQIGADISALNRRLGEMQTNVGQAAKKSENLFSKAFSGMGLSSKVSFVAAMAAAVAFEKKIIAITSETQKFAAVLKTSLGSEAAASGAMSMIADFAAETPFSVQQLTGAFVKLVNAGLIPTEKEMRSLGDLAASTGKDFDMLAEAIIDAQVGEFERLKEFGIRAQTEGNKVIFTYKGVQTQVDKTAESIRGYILTLGETQGVTGSMESISKTLGGTISNLGDNYDQLLIALGKSQGGLQSFFETISGGLAELRVQVESGAVSNIFDALGSSFKFLKAGLINDGAAIAQAAGEINKAYQKGFVASAEDLETQAKATQYVLQNLNKKFGDLSKTPKGAADALKIVENRIVELQNRLGKGDLNVSKSMDLQGQIKAYQQFALTLTKASKAGEEGNKVQTQTAAQIKAQIELYHAQGAAMAEVAAMEASILRTRAQGVAGDVGMDMEQGDLTEMAALDAQYSAYLTNITAQAQMLQSIGGQAVLSFGGSFKMALEGALLSGENFGQAMAQMLKQLVAQILSAVAAAALLNLLFPGVGKASGGFKGLFSTFSGLGSFGAAQFNLNGSGGLGGFRIQGNDLSTSVNRTTQINNRYNGG